MTDDRDRQLQTNHVTEVQLGGRGGARRARGLNLVPALPGVPATRADCPTTRPCPHVQCRHHLQAIDLQDLAGRPRKGAPVTRAAIGDVDASRPSCLFDNPRTRRGIPMTAREIAALQRVTDRQVQRTVKRALGKLQLTEEGRAFLRELYEQLGA